MLLGVVAVPMLVQPLERLFAPPPIHYDEATVIAAVGLLVNLSCAWLPKDGHPHDHGHHHGRAGHGHHHQDINPRSTCLHVIADMATSALTILALSIGVRGTSRPKAGAA